MTTRSHARLALRSSLLLAGLAGLHASGTAQVSLVKDINARPLDAVLSSNPRHMTLVGMETFFVAEDRDGTQLWKSGGTSASTSIVPGLGPNVATPNRLFAYGNKLVLSAWDRTHGEELWVVENGRARLLYDIHAGPINSSPANFTEHNGDLYFTTFDAVARTQALWRSDGTASGLRKLANFGSDEDSIRSLTSVGTALLFFAVTNSGRLLHVSDGTPLGTRALVSPSGPLQQTRPGKIVVRGTRAYFAASSNSTGEELWSSDGSATGTRLVADLRPGPESSSPSELTMARNKIWFRAYTSAAGYELWESDGTTSGTKLHDLVAGSAGSSPTQLTAVGGTLCFAASSAAGQEPWISDSATPRQIADLAPGSASSVPRQFALVGNAIIFVATVAGATRLYASRGAASNTQVLSSVPPALRDFRADVIAVGPYLLFAGDEGKGLGVELYRSFFSSNSTTLVSDLHKYRPGETYSSSIDAIARVGARAYFAANDGVHGIEAWVSDGSSANTQRLTDIAPGNASSYPGEFTPTRNGVVFRATRAQEGSELWVLRNGVASLLADVRPGAGSSSPRDFIGVGGLAYFVADGPSFVRSLYVTDGTAAGTKAIAPAWTSSPVVRMHDAYYWLHRDLQGASLMRSDGTSAGTKALAQLFSYATTPDRMRVVGNRLFVLASTNSTGDELWVCDGQRVTLVADIIPGQGDGRPKELTAVGDLVFFTVETSAGRELWRSDGTTNGTFLVRDILAQYSTSGPTQLMAVGDECWFRAWDGTATGIWKSDGTRAGTRLVAIPANMPTLRARVGDAILFEMPDPTLQQARHYHTIDRRTGAITALRATNNARLLGPERYDFVGAWIDGRYVLKARSGVEGDELHVWNPGATAMPRGSSCAGSGRNPRLDASGPRIGKTWTLEGRGFAAQRATVSFLGAPATLPLTLPGGCDLHVDLASYLPISTSSNTSWSQAFALPNDKRLIGTTFAVQSLQLASDRALGFDLSAALQATLGG